MITPVEYRDGVWFKRDDLYQYAGVRGGKVRTCAYLAARARQKGFDGLTTASARTSPQAVIVAAVAKATGMTARIHMPFGNYTEQMDVCTALGANIIQHRPGFNTVINAAAEQDRSHFLIPFGMQCREAVNQTRMQVENLPPQVKHIVMPVGSGMSLAGILWGLKDYNRHNVNVTGVCVGADPVKRLQVFAPWGWRRTARLVYADSAYEDPAADLSFFHGIQLDPYYEAKAVPYIDDGSLFWLVGIRGYFHEDRPDHSAFIAEGDGTSPVG